MAHWPLNWNVVRHDLVVGSGPREPSDLDTLRVATRVSAVLSLQHDECLEKQEIDYPRLVRYGRRIGLAMERCPFRDFDPADQQRGLPAAVRGLWDLLRQGHRVYVHCTAGINRSPLVVLAYLTLVEGMSLEEAITLLLHARPEVCPTWEAYHGCRQELRARHEDRIRQRAFECSQRQPESSALDHWLQAERAIWREVLTAGSSRARPCCKPAVLVEHEHPVPRRAPSMAYAIPPILDPLGQAFPACFSRSAPKPLKIGLGEELMALAGAHPALADLTRTRMRRALKVYTGAATYRRVLAKGGPRYDLAGQPAGEVTPEQQSLARTPRPTPPTSPTPNPEARPLDLTALLQEVIAMAIPGKLDVTLKITQLPQAKLSSPQTVLFAVQADGQTVVVELKNKAWNTLKTAAENYPQWVAAITGKMGDAVAGGFRLDHPSLQVFEKKAKPETTAPGEPKTSEPPAIERLKLSLKGHNP